MLRFRHPLLSFPLLCLSAISLASSLLAGERYDPVMVHSFPSGATVRIDGRPLGATPLELRLSTRREHSIRIERGGFEAQEAVIQRELDPGLLRNLFLSGIGWSAAQTALELSNGQGFALAPGSLFFHLRRTCEIDAQVLPLLVDDLLR